MNDLIITRLSDLEIRLGRKIKILIIEDHEMFREGLRLLISSISSLQVIADFDNSADLFEFLKTQQPDVILMDIKLKQESGIEITEKLRILYPQIQVVALSMYDEPNIIMKMISSGAKGYLLKNTTKEEVKQAILNVMQGQDYYSKEAATTVMQKIAKKPIHGLSNLDFKGFSLREVQIIKLLCDGKSNKEIAHVLSLSTRTVETHRLRIMKKMNVDTLAELIKYAVKNGFYEIE